MTSLFLDGFDHYGLGQVGAENMLDGAWAEIQFGSTNYDTGPNVPPWGSRTGLYALKGNQFNQAYRYVLPAAKTRIFMSFGWATDGLPSADFQNLIVQFCNASNVVYAKLWCQADGSAVITDGSNTVLGSTQGPVFVSRSWHFLEMDFDPTGGKFTLRVDDSTGTGTAAIAATGLTYTYATVGQLRFINPVGGSAKNMWMDDLFIRDTAGTVNNSWLGDRRVACLFANADTTTSGWTPSYYKKFGAGILTLGYVVPNDTSIHNPTAAVYTAHASSLDIGAADFTMETMVRFDALPDPSVYSAIFSRWDAEANGRSFRLVYGGSSFNNSCLQFDTSTDGTASTIATPILYPWTPVLNTWYHLAVVRAAGQLLLFVNGQQLGLPIADSRTYYSGGTEVMVVGAQIGSSTGVLAKSTLAGRLDETRFTNGVGRYTGTFTPPVAAFPRGSGDANWASVVWLMGYDSGVVDESSFTRALTVYGGAASYLPSDGPNVGVYSTVNKANPDDNTFMAAGLLNATNVLTMTTQPSNGDTVTLGTKDGTNAAVYTFKTALASAFDVLIDTTAQGTLTNLLNAINIGTGAGTKYGTGTTANYDVNGSALPAGQILVTANLAGTGGNSIPSTKTGTAASWATTTLSGGANIPGPTDFYFQRPPNNTTIISALQTNIRALKTDAGTATLQTAFIGPLGGTKTGGTHALTISPDYYADIIEIDPDTSGPLSPTSIINGKFQINRTA